MNIREIAEKAGVSVATVSRVLNHPAQVTKAKREHVLAVMQEYHYEPNWLARALNLNRTGVIGLVLPDIGDPLYIDTVKGADEVSFSKGYISVLCPTGEQPGRETEYISMLLNRKVDGILFISSFLQEENYRKIGKAGVPLVYVGCNNQLENTNMVKADLAFGAYEATCHLFETGCQTMAFIQQADNREADREKLRGIQKAFEEHGLPKQLTIITAENGIDGGHFALRKILQLPHKPDAVLAANDQIAVGFSQGAKAEGLRIPEDISLVGFDGSTLGGLVEPKLTTVEIPAYRMGLLAARLLFDIMETEDTETQVITLPTKLKIRKSCGL